MEDKFFWPQDIQFMNSWLSVVSEGHIKEKLRFAINDTPHLHLILFLHIYICNI